VQEGATVALTKSALIENRDFAVAGSLVDTRVTLTECVVARTLPRDSDQGGGVGAGVMGGATLSVEASALLENRMLALWAINPGTQVSVSGSLLARTLPRASDLIAGRAVEVHEGAALVLHGSTLVDNREVALRVGDAGSSATVTESFFGRTLPQESDGTYGMGVGCSPQAHLELVSSMVGDSTTAGVFFSLGCTGQVRDSLLERVAEGRFHGYVCPFGPPPCPGVEQVQETYEGIADGLVVGFGSTVDVARTLIAQAPRAAILYHESNGSLRGVHATGGLVGLMLQGEPRPDWDDSNVFAGGDQAIVSDGNLPIPGAPPLPNEN
jgi:hypothetical protein